MASIHGVYPRFQYTEWLAIAAAYVKATEVYRYVADHFLWPMGHAVVNSAT
jgi:hypothetical protein